VSGLGDTHEPESGLTVSKSCAGGRLGVFDFAGESFPALGNGAERRSDIRGTATGGEFAGFACLSQVAFPPLLWRFITRH
jgi:hypothetical protein